MLENGECASITELAEAEKINWSYVCRVLRLTLLAQEIVEAVLDGRRDEDVALPALMKGFSGGVEELHPRSQRRARALPVIASCAAADRAIDAEARCRDAPFSGDVEAGGIGLMAKGPSHPRVDSAQVKELLRRYECPVPYHEVRTRFLGNIASPDMSASPLRVVENLWGGKLPAFDSMEDMNALIGVLVNGLWNALTRHQKRTEPFRLLRVQGDPTPETLARLAQVRQQEIDGFVEGLFHGADEIDLPEKALRALNALGEIGAMMAGTVDLYRRASGRRRPRSFLPPSSSSATSRRSSSARCTSSCSTAPRRAAPP